MAIDLINVGTANQGDGDPLRDAFVKANSMFTELYSDDAGDVGSVYAATAPIEVDAATGDVTVISLARRWNYLRKNGFRVYNIISFRYRLSLASDVDFEFCSGTFTKPQMQQLL